MVNSDHVKESEHSLNSLNPPTPVLLFMSVPIVENRPPFLSMFAEVIWGYARHVQGHAVGVKLKQFTMRPNVRRIVSDEDGNVANQCDVASLGLFGQNRPSSLEALLMLAVDSRCVLVLLKRLRVAVSKRCWPFKPRLTVVGFLDGGVQGPVLEPPLIIWYWIGRGQLHEFWPSSEGGWGGIG